MAFIEWSEEYSVNVKEIDDQHKYFVSIINNLYDATQKKETDVLGDIINQLVSYAQFHFATEEKYFDQFNYEGTKEHKEEHQKLKEKVGEFLARKDEPQPEICFELLDFLEDWLVNHLADQDRKYMECFAENGLK